MDAIRSMAASNLFALARPFTMDAYGRASVVTASNLFALDALN